MRLQKPDECAVCYEKLNMKKPLSCGHWIHKQCIVNSLKSQCPLCRNHVELPKEYKVQLQYLKLIDEYKLVVAEANTKMNMIPGLLSAIKKRENDVFMREQLLRIKTDVILSKEKQLLDLEDTLKRKDKVMTNYSYILYTISFIVGYITTSSLKYILY